MTELLFRWYSVTMNEKQFEECSFEEATHIEINGKTYELGNGLSKHQVLKYNSDYIGVCIRTHGWQLLHVGTFSMFGIKTLREKEKKREPMVFTHTVGGGIAPPNKAYGKTFLCVEILEDEE